MFDVIRGFTVDYALFGLRLRLRPRPRPFAGASTSTSRLRHQQGPSNVSYSCSARHQHRSNPSILFDYLVNSPAPTNLSYFWSLGSLPTFMGIRLGLASIDVMLFGRVQL